MEVYDLSTKAKIIILFANSYDMLDERHSQLTGCSVHYLFWGEQGERLFPQSEWDVSKPVGVQRAKCSIDMALRSKIPVAPALYEGTFFMTVGSDGKPVLKLKDIAYVSNVEIAPKVIPGLIVPGMIAPEPDKVDAVKASK